MNTNDKFYSRLPSHVKFVPETTTIKKKEIKNIKTPFSEADEEKVNSTSYPMEMNQIVYDSYDLKIIYDRDKTGFEEQREIKIVIN